MRSADASYCALVHNSGRSSVFVVRAGIFPYFQGLQPNPTFPEQIDLLFRLVWDSAFRGVVSGPEGFNCKGVHEHHLFCVLRSSLFSSCFSQDNYSFSAQSLISLRGGNCLVRQPTHRQCYLDVLLPVLQMLIGKCSSLRYFYVGFCLPKSSSTPQ